MSTEGSWRGAEPRAGRPASGRTLRADGEEMAGTILECGRAVLNLRGYRGTRVDDVAQAAGVARGTFYLYFRDTEDLLHRLAADAYDDLHPLAVRLGTLKPGDDDALREWMDDFVTAYQRHGVIVRVWLEHGDVDPWMEWSARRVIGGIVDGFGRWTGGDGTPDAERGLAVFAMVEHLTAYMSPRGTTAARSVVDTLTRLVGAAAHHGVARVARP